MGFKSKARKKRSAADTAAGRTGKDLKDEFEGQVRCQVAGCENFADKKVGGRRLAFDRAAARMASMVQRAEYQSAKCITEKGRKKRRTT